MATSNPCFSCCNPYSPPQTSICKAEDCICFCDIYISPKADEAVICGVQGTVDLNDYPNDTEVCGLDTVKYALMYFDAAFFTAAAITEGGVLTWTPDGNALTKTGQLVFKVMCGHLARLVTVTIGRRSNCEGVNCPSGMRCNDCSGLCLPIGALNLDLTTTVN